MKRTIKRQSDIEVRYNKPLRQVLIDLFNEKGLKGGAKQLGVPISTFSYWCLREGIKTRVVAE